VINEPILLVFAAQNAYKTIISSTLPEQFRRTPSWKTTHLMLLSRRRTRHISRLLS